MNDDEQLPAAADRSGGADAADEAASLEASSSGEEAIGRDQLILSRLQAAHGQFVSGTELAELLGVSRAAVGKRALHLRQKGWPIDAVPNRGYRLVGELDALDFEHVEPLLTTDAFGRVYFWLPQVDSTSSEAKRRAEDGAPHGTVVLAEEQQAGRGRMARSWRSPAGGNIYLSLVLRPTVHLEQLSLLSIAVAVAVAEALRGFVGAPPTVKWPNDLLYKGRKVAGILIELTSDGSSVRYVVLGLGVNVNVDQFPQELAPIATSVREERGHHVTRAALLAAILNSLEHWCDRLFHGEGAAVVEAWTALAPWLGSEVRLNQGATPIGGTALGLDERGGLRLRLADGTETVVYSGEIASPLPQGR